jgi:dUTP pyrophosphatase
MSTIEILPSLQAYLGTNVSSYKPAYSGESVGVDLYNASTSDIEVAPFYPILIPTGIKLHLDKNQAGILHERGSITKTHLMLRAGVIDPGYTGEVFVSLFNLNGSEPYIIKAGSKLPVQLVIYDTKTNHLNVSLEPISISSKRMDGKIGSSDLS